MQRDTDLAFEDIHGTQDVMLENLSKIFRPAAVIAVASSKTLDLRFLEFDNTSLDDENPILNLTERGQNIGETNYVAVSYTWQKFDPITNAEAISRFKVSTGESVRKARSQDAVLRRAIQFARAANARFIWIDQDCIDQKDPDDIIRHFHLIHEIFYQSCHAIGLLSFRVSLQSQIDSIRYIHETLCLEELDRLLEDATLDNLAIARKLSKAFRLFAAISADKWFLRTWTFMERLSAPHMLLLLPCDASLITDKQTSESFPELELHLHRLYQIRKRFEEAVHYHSNDKWTVLGHQSSHQALCDSIDRFRRLLASNYLTEFSTPPWTETVTLQQVAIIFRHIEEHDNTVLSDRLLVLGYLCGFPRRLETARLNHYQYSYSTCVFGLLLMNGLLDDLKQKVTGSFLLNHTLGETLAYCCLQDQPRSPHALTASGEMEEIALDQENVREHFLENARTVVNRFL